MENIKPPIYVSHYPIHIPLLNALSVFKQRTLPAGTRLFHGSRAKSLHTDVEAQKLSGTRKWLSQSAQYAVSYAYSEQGELGPHLLWVCELATDVSGLHGSQAALVQSSPWAEQFPWEFPNAFADYANIILRKSGPKALIDHQQDGIFKEILITTPTDAIRVVEVTELPQEKPEGEALANIHFNC